MSCEACGWSPEHQDRCRYNSNVRLFRGLSDRGAWSLGSQYILKERSMAGPNFEAPNIRFLSQQTSIPIPTIIIDWEEENGRYFLFTERIQGQSLDAAWPTMTTVDKERVAMQTAEYILQLRKLQSPQMQSLDEQPVYSAFLFPNGYGVPHGPLSSDDELWNEMDKALGKVPIKARQRLRERMPPASPFTFTHGDLTNSNIMVKEGNLVGILDWEASGYFPVWWEFTCAGIGLGQEDSEWKTLLRKYMPDHTEARQFWLDYFGLRRYPELDARGEEVLEGLLRD